MNEIERVSEWLSKLYGLPGYACVLVFCVILGYILKSSKRFPNDGIPLVLFLAGMIFNSLIADPLADSLSLRVWLVKNAVIGGIIGGMAWVAHYQWIKRFKSRMSDTELSYKEKDKGK